VAPRLDATRRQVQTLVLVLVLLVLLLLFDTR